MVRLWLFSKENFTSGLREENFVSFDLQLLDSTLSARNNVCYKFITQQCQSVVALSLMFQNAAVAKKKLSLNSDDVRDRDSWRILQDLSLKDKEMGVSGRVDKGFNSLG